MTEKNKFFETVFILSACVCLSLFMVISWHYYASSSIAPRENLWVLFSGLLGCLSLFVMVLMRSLEGEKQKIKKGDRHEQLKLELLECEIKYKEAKAEEFLEACSALFNKSDLNEICDEVMEVIYKTLEADQGSLMLIDANQRLKIVASRGLPDDVASKVHLKLGERVAGVSASEKKEFLLNGELENYPLFQGLEPNPLIRSSIIVPVCHKDEVLGVLNMSRTRHGEKFNVQDLKRATALAGQVAMAIHQSLMVKELRENAIQLKRAYHYLKKSQTQLKEIEKFSGYLDPSKKLKAS